MTAPRDPNRLIDAFLSEGQTDLPDHVYDEVRTEIEHTGQRTVFGPWRNPFVNRFFTVAAVAAVVVLAVIVGLQLGAGGPLVGGPGPSASASAPASVDPSASGEPSAQPSPSVEPSAEPSTGVEPPFTCDLPITLDAVGSDFHPLITQDIRVGTHDGYDRIVFEYDGGTPNLELDLAQPPYVQNPSGLPIEVNGSVVYRITLGGATKYDTETGEQPYQGPTNFEPGYAQIVQFVEYGDFEATHNWFLGVNSGDCLRAFTLLDPSRLVIDIQH
ncbi:MAG: hypothetical protein AABM41_00420 [Chloroflexota bacterium]